MKRHILSQIRREWRSNLWLVIELAVIGIIMWGLILFLITLLHTRYADKGYTLEDIYVGDIKTVPSTSEFYQQYPDSAHSYSTDLQLLRANLTANPYVEKVGVGTNAMPYNYNYSGTAYELPTGDTTSVTYYGNKRMMSPEIIEIIQLQGLNGETPGQLAAVLERGEVIFSDYQLYYDTPEDKRIDFEAFRNQDVRGAYDSLTVHVGALARGLQRSDYEPLFRGVIYMPIGDFWPYQIVFKVKPGRGNKFVESLSAADRQIGNVYIANLRSIERMRDAAHIDVNNFIRNMVLVSVFMLIVVFLSFLGAFWFRTQQRVGEIAVRVVNGATRQDILRRFFTESVLLLCFATVISGLVEMVLIKFDLLELGGVMQGADRFEWLAMVVAFVFMVLIILAGVWAPARRAMNIDPAYALKDQ